jgi:FkbM family methyltransferase
VHCHTFLPRGLDETSVILDLGANKGLFSQKMSNLFESRVYSIEASPILFEILEQRRNISSFNYAISDSNEMLEFNISSATLGSSLKTVDHTQVQDVVQVQGIRLDSFLEQNQIERVDLMKVDIEGAEIDVFDSLSDDFFTRISQITIEFHDFCSLTPSSEVKRIVRRLEQLGFVYFRMSRVGNQDAFFVNKELISISKFEEFYIRYVVNPVLGIYRCILKLFVEHLEGVPHYR